MFTHSDQVREIGCTDNYLTVRLSSLRWTHHTHPLPHPYRVATDINNTDLVQKSMILTQSEHSVVAATIGISSSLSVFKELPVAQRSYPLIPLEEFPAALPTMPIVFGACSGRA